MDSEQVGQIGVGTVLRNTQSGTSFRIEDMRRIDMKWYVKLYYTPNGPYGRRIYFYDQHNTYLWMAGNVQNLIEDGFTFWELVCE
jgi:hypothetical protein